MTRTADEWTELVIARLDNGHREWFMQLEGRLKMPKNMWPKVRYQLQRHPRVVYIKTGPDRQKWKTVEGDPRWIARGVMRTCQEVLGNALRDLVIRDLKNDAAGTTAMLDINHALWEIQNDRVDPLRIGAFVAELEPRLLALAWPQYPSGNYRPYWFLYLTRPDDVEKRALGLAA